jgi:hypothetical protein
VNPRISSRSQKVALSVQLLHEGEIAPGLTLAELKLRRRQLAAKLPDDSVAIIASAPQRFVTGIIPYPYRQEADFYWLTGITQPAVAILHKGRGAGVPLCSLYDGLVDTQCIVANTPPRCSEDIDHSSSHHAWHSHIITMDIDSCSPLGMLVLVARDLWMIARVLYRR